MLSSVCDVMLDLFAELYSRVQQRTANSRNSGRRRGLRRRQLSESNKRSENKQSWYLSLSLSLSPSLYFHLPRCLCLYVFSSMFICPCLLSVSCTSLCWGLSGWYLLRCVCSPVPFLCPSRSVSIYPSLLPPTHSPNCKF